MKRSRFTRALCVALSLHLVLGLVPVEALASAVANHGEEQEAVSAPPEFDQSTSLDGVTIRAKAGEGAFPEDAVLEVAHLTDEQLAASDEAVARVRPDDAEPLSSHAWSVRVDDSAGNELKPAHEQKVTLELYVEEAEDKGQKPQVYAITEAQGEGELPTEAQTEAEAVDQAEEQTVTTTATSLGFAQDFDIGVITFEVDELSTYVVVFVPAEDPLSASQGGNAPPAEGSEGQAEPTDNEADSEAGNGEDAPAANAGSEGQAEPTASEADNGEPATATNADKPTTTNEVTARSATENIVGEVFANSANKALSGEGSDELGNNLEQYPTENHEESYYKDSPRLRQLHSSEGHDMGFLVYRDTFLLVSQEEGASYDVTQSDDGSTAFVTPALDPATLEGKTGIVILREDIGHDVVLVFAEGQSPALDGDTLVVPLAATEDLTLSQLFSDGSIAASADYKGPRRLGPNDCVIAQDDAQPKLLKTQEKLLSPQSSPEQAPLQTQATFKPIIHPNPSGTNWKATIDPLSVSIDDVGAHFAVDIFDLEFDLVVDLALGFDFEVSSTGASKGRERCEAIGLDVSLELFTLHYAALFEAQFDSTPVHIAGRMNAKMGCHWNPLFGFSVRDFKTPIDLRTFELVHPERDANKEFLCYLGTGFYINQGFLSLSVDLGVWEFSIGPVASINHLGQGGTYFTGKLEKNQYDPESFSRTQESVHECAANDKEGCYVIHAHRVSDYSWFVKLDLYFKSWPGELKAKHSDLGDTDYYNSLEHRTGLQQGICPHLLYRVPVKVLTKDGTSELPVQGMSVSPAMYIDMGDVSGQEYDRYVNDTTDASGQANVFLPYRAGGRYSLIASGTLQDLPVVGSAQQPSDMRMGVNDEVKIYLKANEYAVVEAQATWDSDKDGNERPSFTVVVQMRTPSSSEWKVVGWCKLVENAYFMANYSDGSSRTGPFLWSHRWPKYSLVNGAYELNEYRVLQLRDFTGPAGTDTALVEPHNYNAQNDAYFMDLASGAWTRREFDAREHPVDFSAEDLRAIEEEVAQRAVLPDSSDPYVQYPVELYTDSHGLNVPRHSTTFLVHYDVSQGEDELYDVITTTMNNKAVADVDIHKVWNTSPDATKPSEVYVALMQRPYAEWASYAREQGVPTEWVPALNPIEGPATTLHELMREGVMSWANVYDIEDVPLTIAKVSEAGAWTCSFKVPRYRNGIPLEYEAVELSSDVIRNLLNYEYHSNQIVNVVDQWSGGSLPGLAYAAKHDARYTANVTNTSADQEHTIGGTIFWYNPQREDNYALVRLPDYVIIHVFDEDGHEVGSTRVNRDDFPGSYVWTWSLTGDDIHSYENYSIYEDFDATENGGVLLVGWHGESHGLDVINHFTGAVPRLMIHLEADVDAPADSTPTGDALQVELVDEKGQVIGTYPLEYDASTGQYRRYELGSYSWSTFAGRDIEHYSVRVKNPQAFSSQYGDNVVTTYTTSCTYEYLPPGSSIGGDLPVYTFHITGVVRADVQLDTTVVWTAAEGATIPSGAIPDSVTPQVLRNEDTIPTAQFEVRKSDGWKATYTDPSLEHLSNDKRNTYSLVAPHVDGFASAVAATDANTLNPKFTITYTYLGETGVDVAGTITWTGDAGKERLRPTGPIDLAIVAQTEGKPKTAHTVEHIQIIPPTESGENTNAWSAKDLPRYDSNGEILEYSALQETAYGYTTTYAAPAFDESTRTWTCDCTNTLTGYFPLTIQKKVAGNPQDKDEQFTFQIARIAVSEDKSETPAPVTDIVQIAGEGEAQAEFLIAADGLYLYRITERKGSDPSCVYDTSPRTVLIVRTTDEQGKVSFRSFVADTKDESGASNEPSSELTSNIVSAATQAPLLQALAGDEKSTVEFVNRYPGITVEKKWDIDLEGKDKPGTIDVAVQRKTEAGGWETVQTVTLGEDGEWKKSLPLPGGANDRATYRVRELKDPTVVGELEGSSRIVYDSSDADKGEAKTNEVVYSVGAYDSAVSGAEGAHKTKYRVTYNEEEVSHEGGQKTFVCSITNKAIVEIDVIKRWIHPGVDEKDLPDSAWLVLMCQPKAGALDAARNLPGVDLSGVLDYEFPVVNPLQGGQDPLTILGSMALGLDLSFIGKAAKSLFGIKVPTLALKKVTKDDSWRFTVVDSKYTAGIPKEYKGAELTSEIIRLIVKYLTNGVVDSPVSFNPFGGYISIPTKAVRTVMGITDLDLSKLKDKALEKARSLTLEDIKDFGPSTLLDDWHLMANAINVKVDWDTDDDQPDDPADTSIHGKKTWNDQNDRYGLRPESVKVYLLANGQRVKDDDGNDVYAETSQTGGWRYSFANRGTTDDAGNAVVYSVEEEPVAGYEATYSGYNITNTLKTRDIRITKQWDDADNQDGKRPASVSVHLLAAGDEVASLDLSEAGGWTGVFEKVPAQLLDDSGGQKAYAVSEDAVEGYTTSVSGNATGGFTITNRHEPETITVSGAKIWDDADNQDSKRPTSVTVRLRADGAEVRSAIVSAQSNWLFSFAGLPKYAVGQVGQEIEYTLAEDAVDDYIAEVSGNAQSGFVVTNTHAPQTAEIAGSKTWDDADNQDGKRPASITVRLRANGEVVDSRTVTEADGWTWSFGEQPVYRDGQKVVYTVTEDLVEGYATAITGSVEGGFTITNSYAPQKTQVYVYKMWNDRSDAEGVRPASVTVRLKANGVLTGKALTLEEAGGWLGTFADLDKFADGGHEIDYTVEEDEVPGYEARIERGGATPGTCSSA